MLVMGRLADSRDEYDLDGEHTCEMCFYFEDVGFCQLFPDDDCFASQDACWLFVPSDEELGDENGEDAE